MKIISTYEYNQLKEKAGRADVYLEDCKKAEKAAEEIQKEMNSMQDKFELKEKQAVAALEDKLAKEISKLEKSHNNEIVKLERDLRTEKQNDLEKMTKDHYKKLSDSMTKLHEEGNAQTKFMQETVQNVIKSASGFATATNTHTQITHETVEE